jgi:hypothetical protein
LVYDPEIPLSPSLLFSQVVNAESRLMREHDYGMTQPQVIRKVW